MTQKSPAPTNRLLALATRIGVAVLLLAAAAGIYFVLYSTRPQVEVTDPEANRPKVTVFAARRVPVQRQWLGYGSAEALDTADVPARVTATVEDIPKNVLPGASVTRGQTLVQLDRSDFQRQVEIATQRIAEIDAMLAQLDVEEQRMTERLALEDSDVAIAQTEYDRQLRFQQRDVATQQDVDAAQRTLITAQRSRLQTREALDLIGPRRLSLEAQKSSQQSQVNLAELNEQRTTVVSPIDGVIQSLEVEIGENLQAGARVARVVSPARIEVPIALPASARQTVAVGDKVVLRPTGPLPNIVGQANTLGWTTTICRIAPEQDADTRTLTVFAELMQDSKKPVLLPAPGMFLAASVWVSDVEQRFVVPRQAVRAGRIQVVSDGVLVSRAADVAFNVTGKQPVFGLAEDQWAVLNDGVLEAGDLVVANASTRLADGTAVETNLANGGDDKPPVGNDDKPTADTQRPVPGAGAGATP